MPLEDELEINKLGLELGEDDGSMVRKLVGIDVG